MGPGLYIAGMISGLLLSVAYQDAAQRRPSALPPGPPQPPGPPRPVPGVPTHPKIAEAQQKFLPATAENVRAVTSSEPEAASSWRAMAGRLPFLTEAVAMYYAMEDPAVPMRPKVQIAGSILYLVSPMDVIPDYVPIIGQLDDAGVLMAALYDVYTYIEPRHMEQAQEWLRSMGVEPKPLFAIGKDFSADVADVHALRRMGKIQPQASSPVQPRAFIEQQPPQLPGPTSTDQQPTPFEGFGVDPSPSYGQGDWPGWSRRQAPYHFQRKIY